MRAFKGRTFKPIDDLSSVPLPQLRAYRDRAKEFGNRNEAARAEAILNASMIGDTSGLSPACVRRVAETIVVYREAKGSNNIGGTLKIFRNRGTKGAIEHLVLMPEASDGFRVLVERGRLDAAFERVVDEFPEEFSADAVNASRIRISEFPKSD